MTVESTNHCFAVSATFYTEYLLHIQRDVLLDTKVLVYCLPHSTSFSYSAVMSEL